MAYRRPFKSMSFQRKTQVAARLKAVRSSRKATIQSVARRVVKQELNKQGEPKKFDTAVAYGQIDRAGRLTQLTTIPQGSGQGARVGDELTVKELQFRYDTYYNSASGLGAQHNGRIILFRWNIDTSIATPSLGSILQAVGAIIDNAAPLDYNAMRQGDFQVLFDKRYSVGSTAPSPSFTWKFKLANRVVFDPASTSGEGHLYCLELSDDVTGAHTPDIQAQFQARVLYSDS